MKVADFGPPTYPTTGHAVLVRLGQQTWQTQVCIDGVWIMASKATLTAAVDSVHKLVLEIPVGLNGDFKVEWLGAPVKPSEVPEV